MVLCGRTLYSVLTQHQLNERLMDFLGTAGEQLSNFNNYLICGFDLCLLSEAIVCNTLSFGSMRFVHCPSLEDVHISEVEMH